jgi:hypothetical protein
MTMTTTVNFADNIAAIARVLAAAGDMFHGGDIDGTAAEWDMHDYTAAGVERWTAIGVWEPGVADAFVLAGVTPRKVAIAAETMDGDPIYAACNGDLSPQAIIDAWQAM